MFPARRRARGPVPVTGRLRVLVVGGYGTFGGRLARLLADEPRLTLLIAGRSQAAASAFCVGLPAAAELVPMVFDPPSWSRHTKASA